MFTFLVKIGTRWPHIPSNSDYKFYKCFVHFFYCFVISTVNWIFSKKMNLEERLKIQKNYSYLLNDLSTDDVVDNLLSNDVINHDDLQRVHSEKTDKDKVRSLLDILLRTKNSFGPFLKEIESSRPDLAKKIMMTDVSEELNKGMHINTHLISFIMVWVYGIGFL